MKVRVFGSGLLAFSLCLVAPACKSGPRESSTLTSPSITASASSVAPSGFGVIESLFSGKVHSEPSAESEDLDLKSALVKEGDLPSGYVIAPGDVRFAAGSPASPIRAVFRALTNESTFCDVYSVVVSGLQQTGGFDLSARSVREQASKFFGLPDVLDTSGIGETSFGISGTSGIGGTEIVVWNRGGLTYLVLALYPNDPVNPPSAVALASTVDGRAQAQSN
jgi:hypothetical protein